jgi:hypothetical protein
MAEAIVEDDPANSSLPEEHDHAIEEEHCTIDRVEDTITRALPLLQHALQC